MFRYKKEHLFFENERGEQVTKKKRDFPAIFFNVDFIPVGQLQRIWFYETNINIVAFRAVLKKDLELGNNNEANDFHEHFILIPTHGEKDFVENLGDFSGLGVKARLMSCKREGSKYQCAFITERKVKIQSFAGLGAPFFVKAEYCNLYGVDTLTVGRLLHDCKEILEKLVRLGVAEKGFIEEIGQAKNIHTAADIMIYELMKSKAFSKEEQRELFDELNASKLLEKIYKCLSDSLIGLEVDKKIDGKIKDKMKEDQRRFHLMQRKQQVLEELNKTTGADEEDDTEELAKRIELADMPLEAGKVAQRELERYSQMPKGMMEANISRDYIITLCDYPWNKKTKDIIDLKRAKEILDRDLYALEKVKRRIVEFLAIFKLNPKKRGMVLCYDGPPGTGKTLLARVVAEATGRKFVRISLGGVRDEAEIRGHRRTYVGAMAGRIVKGMIEVGVNNPVFDLDEIDKMSQDSNKGDPASALLEVLDPKQNYAFSDHYIGPEIPIDLSNVIFICTSNYWGRIPATLRDRLECFNFDGYIGSEKFQIAKRYLIPKQIEEHGLEKYGIEFSEAAVKKIIRQYIREAGVRDLERTLADTLRNRAVLLAQNMPFEKIIQAEELSKILGPEKYEINDRVHVDGPGVVTGLAWTPDGGTTLTIEALRLPILHKGAGSRLMITGKLGKVMTESVRVAATTAFKCATSIYLESKGMDPDYLDKYDFHVSCDEYGIGKEGPSAGTAITLCLLSVILDKKVRDDLALTGEINLRGMLLPVGGIKQKVLAAYRAGFTQVIIPKWNEKDLVDIPERVRQNLNIKTLSRIEEVAEFAFCEQL
ncbi:endopeptidase La [Candidatus Parcubacteria bacterium]|nr:endopeptidase La [Patescibacteria group bacterium]MCG2694445.1 endopeptidase La [Candidatus Parcubacteria bacterium]